MRIDALTTCVGEKYALFLEKSLSVWLDTLDSLTVVTDPNDLPTLLMLSRFTRGAVRNLRVHKTEVFTAHGASFNKGAALASGFGEANPQDWILNFDADVLPPREWRKIAENKIKRVQYTWGNAMRLFGCSHRYRENGSQIPDADFPNIWGFFHLWNVLDSHSWKRPPYDVSVGHAGNYDHSFMMQWPERERVDLWPALKLVHQGEPRQSWFGNDPKNGSKMRSLFNLGLYEAWKFRAGHIRVPRAQEVIVHAKERTPEEVVKVLSVYNDPDPFKFKVSVE